MPRNTNSGQMVYVPIKGTSIKYAFGSRLQEEFHAICGLLPVPVNVTDVTGFVVGANSPKPPRATKDLGLLKGKISSYIDAAKIPDLRAEKWKIQKGRTRVSGGASVTGSKAVYVVINGIEYGWTLSAVNGTQPDVAGLEVLPIEPKLANLVYGAKFPKPPRAKTTLANGSSYSTFCSPTLAELPAGWHLISGKAAFTAVDFAAYAGNEAPPTA